MKPNLYLLTSDFPFGNGEASFIMPELPSLKEKFNVTIISNSLSNVQTTVLDDVRVIHFNRKVSFFLKVWDSICFWGCRSGYEELQCILQSGEKRLERLRDSILFFEEARRLKRFIKRNKIIDDNVPSIIYCYWYTYYCYTLTHWWGKKSNLKIVTRAHRYDLYDDGMASGRQPFKEQMNTRVDAIVFIAKHGQDYFLNRYGLADNVKRYPLFRLGVIPTSSCNIVNKEKNEFLLVSCSVIIPRKRVEMIVQALAQISSINIHWIHFGDGPGFDKLKEKAHELLSKRNNISYDFRGYTKSEDIMDFYANNYVDAFITTTRSEGCPVSVQEAMAYEIPVIGTAVADIPCMIQGNGILLAKNLKISDICEAILTIALSSEKCIRNMRKQSYQIWKDHFDGKRNAEKFAEFLFELLEMKRDR